MEQSAAVFLTFFTDLPDPRQAAKVLYPLPEILLILLCGTLAGADDFVEIVTWADQQQEFLRRFLPFAQGIPSHDTLGDVVGALDPELFGACFAAWVDSLRAATPQAPDGAQDEPAVIAIDGKTSRRSHDRKRGRDPLHLLSAWASRERLVLGQEAVSGKSNEIKAIPRLLQRLDLSGALVTIDAMGTQRDIADIILQRGGNYVLSLKANWPAMLAAAKSVFEQATAATLQTFQTSERAHGRTETRQVSVCTDLPAFFTRKGTRDSPAFPGVGMLARIESTTERGDKIETDTRYFLCSTQLSAKQLARVVRTHWHIENRLHWVLDVVFHEDLARLRNDNAPANMAIVRHMAINLLRQATPTMSLKNRRKRAGWNTTYLEAVLRQAT
jgi:predicted transposase YbfD/YdcC